jgi:hypothetical protein
MNSTYLNNTPYNIPETDTSLDYVTIDGQSYAVIRNVDAMAPFFIKVKGFNQRGMDLTAYFR